MDSEMQSEDLGGFDSFEMKLGDMLRGERATLGKSLLDVQRDLRIKAAYVSAIENCDFSVFPNPGFVAGYVRSYARYLKLDSEEVFRAFCTESGFAGVNSDINSSKSIKGRKQVLSGPALVGKDDALLRSVVPNGAVKSNIFSEMSIAGIGSVLVLAALVGGLGYGGLKVVNSIQRVEITPVNQTPLALSGLVDLDVATTESPDEAVLVASSLKSASDSDLARLYQPRELEIPVVETRDGPIVDIDPDSVGALIGPSVPESVVAEYSEPAELQVREMPNPPLVNVVAKEQAWVRVYLADGSILFEKTLDKGEAYTLPNDVEAPLLRAGNATAVYLLVNDKAYGPVGQGNNVVKQVSLLPDDIARIQLEVLEIPTPILDSTAMQAVVEN